MFLAQKYLIELRDQLDDIIEALDEGFVEEQNRPDMMEHAVKIEQSLSWMKDKISLRS